MSDRPVQPPDPARRRFFRQFAGEVATSVGSVLGAAQVLQQQSADAARELLGGEPAGAAPVAPAGSRGAGAPVAGGMDIDASTAGWRAPFRWDGDVCWVIDQRRLPERLVDLPVRGAADAVQAINEGAVTGAAVQAQLAAVTLALVAGRSRTSRAFARRATIRGAANALRQTRQGSAAMHLALDRMLALLETFGYDADGAAVEVVLRGEAEAIVGEASADHGALVGHALAALPGGPADAVRVLLAGNTGAMGSGQFGTAVSAVITAHHAERPVHALVAEGRPGLEGARVVAWELAQAGVARAVVTDAAAPGCIAAGEVDAVLVSADRVCANGDVVAPAGTYPLALAAHAAAVPFLVLVATTGLDPRVPTAADAPLEEGRPGPVLAVAGTRIAPEGTTARNPRQDRTPARLVTSIVTELGPIAAPFADGIAAQAAAADARRAGTAAGMAALLAERAAAHDGEPRPDAATDSIGSAS
jgi:eIF-2B alpha/beta/delta-like uncharacterized protein